MITVLLYGELQKLFGKTHRFAVKNTKEALKALAANFKGFSKAIREDDYYKIIVDNKNISQENINTQIKNTIKIIPLIRGTGFSIPATILGKVLLAAIVITTVVVLSSFASMRAKNKENKSGADRPDNKPSYYFDGVVNTSAQGNPVPWAYGKILCGSQVVSLGFEVTA